MPGSGFMRRRTSCIWMSDRRNLPAGEDNKGEDQMDLKTLLDIIANQGFPIALSILLIFRIDRFMQEIVVAQKEGYRQVLENTKEIHNTITTLNQQNREYYFLRFSEVQKELSGMKVELGKIE